MNQPFPWRPFWSELIGSALLVLVGLSLVIVMFGTGSPMARLIPSEGLRRLITGFLFGTTGATIALSAVGKESGAHINPVVTMAFWLFRKLDSRTAMIYVLAHWPAVFSRSESPSPSSTISIVTAMGCSESNKSGEHNEIGRKVIR